MSKDFGVQISIPPEIVAAFDRKDTGYNLLLKGRAGVGKTTFALSILDSFKDFEPIYLSTRVAPSSIYSQFPWLKERLQVENILDATRTYIPPVKNPDQMKPHLMRTLRFSSVPEFMKIIYEKVAQYENPIIVIDSWDAIIGSELDNKENIETLFTEFIRQTNAKLILIAESDDDASFLNYIVDGILTISDKMVEGRTLRSLQINKIRAVERCQKEYAFTLFGNRFQYAQPFEDLKPNRIETWEPTQDQNELFSIGNESLDQLYHGGLKQGTFNLLEVESSVPISSYSPVMIGAICNFISQNRGVIVSTMDGINSELIDKKRLFLYLPTDSISKHMRILMEKLLDRNEIRPYIIQTETEEFNDVFFDVYAKLSSITKFQPVFAGVSYDTLQFQVHPNALANFYKHLKLIRNSNVIELGIINTYQGSDEYRKNDTLTQDLSYAADTHTKIIERFGAIFIYGIKPRSYIHYMRINYEKGYPKVDLIPIV